MEYEYRNIDTDIELLKAAREYWEVDDFSKQDMYDYLANRCYSKWEADRAISDYYYVHVWSKILLGRILTAFAILIIFMAVLGIVQKIL